jgi:flagellar motor protein MotB
MLPSISQRALQNRVARFAPLAVAVLAVLVLPACVPYVKYEDAMSKLGRANQVNQDLERTLRDAQIDEGTTGGDLRAAVAKIESLEIQNASLLRQQDILQQEKQALIDRLSNLPPITVGELDTGHEVNQDTGGIILEGDVLFASGKSTLRNEAKASLDRLIGMIQRDYADHFVFVDGHTDITPIKSSGKVNKSNWDLAAKRAHAVFAYFKEKGIDQDRMVLTSRGFAQPISGVDEKSKAGMSRCRRVEIRLRPVSY